MIRAVRHTRLPRLKGDTMANLGLSYTERKIAGAFRRSLGRYGVVYFGGNNESCEYSVNKLWELVEKFVDLGLLPANVRVEECGTFEDPGDDPPEPERREIEARIALVREAKHQVEQRTGRSELTPSELDHVIDPVQCSRFRDRMRRTESRLMEAAP